MAPNRGRGVVPMKVSGLSVETCTGEPRPRAGFASAEQRRLSVPRHKLRERVDLVEGLVQLGDALGYAVRQEAFLEFSGHSRSLENEYEALRAELNAHGRIPSSLLSQPPATIDPDNNSWLMGGEGGHIEVPAYSAFRSRALESFENVLQVDNRSIRAVIRSLVEEGIALYWEKDVMELLRTKADRQGFDDVDKQFGRDG